MPRVTYVGPHTEGVEIPGVGEVAHGGSIDVSEPLAASLLEQASNWQPTRAAKTTTTKTAADGEED